MPTPIPLAKKVYMIGSGKGGVGKSTVAVNLAVALAQKGLKVGLLDADIYGPSIPIMMGLRSLSPCVQVDRHGIEKVIPMTKFGTRVISIGFFLEEARSVVWRGPVLHSALQKMVSSVEWGDLDLLMIDLPPGTGDILLSLAQMLKIDGAMIVCTPQEVAMLDAIKAVNAFFQLDIPLIGVIENMAGFTVPGTEQVFHIFGEGKGLELCEKFSTSFFGSIPLMTSIRQSSDEGHPIAFHTAQEGAGEYYQQIAERLIHEHISIPNPLHE